MTITTTPSNNVQSTRDTPKDILEIDISQGLRNTPKVFLNTFFFNIHSRENLNIQPHLGI